MAWNTNNVKENRSRQKQTALAKKDEKVGAFCGATTNTGEPCSQPRGFLTGHPGVGRCKWHEGKANGIPVEMFDIPALEERMELYMKDKNIYSLDREIALCRSYLELFQHHVQIFKSATERLAEVYANIESLSSGDNKITFNPDELSMPLDVSQLTSTINSLTRNIAHLVKQKHEIEVGRKFVIDIRHVHLMVGMIGGIIDKAVTDPDARRLIGDELNKILLPMATRN